MKKDVQKTTGTSGLFTRRQVLSQLAAGAAAVTVAPMALGSASTKANARVLSSRNHITLAMVGGAHIHAPDFANRMRDTENVTTKYVWDPNRETAERRQNVTGGTIVDNPQVIFDDPEIDGVVICSETKHHIDLVPRAVQAGKHVFAEKPVGMNGQETRQIARLVNQQGVIFQTGYFMRSDPVNQKVRELVQNGTMGEITRIRTSNVHSGAIGGWFDGEWRWMADVDQAGVGAFGDMGSHAMDLMLWVLAGDTPRRCTGFVDSVLYRYPGCDEYGEGMVVFASGAVGTVTGGWVSYANPNQLELHGTKGFLRVTNGRLYAQIPELETRGNEPWEDLPEHAGNPLQLFFRAVAGEQNLPLVNVDEAAVTNTVLTKIYNSHSSGRWEWI